MSPARRGPKRSSPDTALGWREWVQLPELGVRRIKAKLDTGARTSALHAFGMREFVRDGVDMVRFEVHPVQRSAAEALPAEATIIDHRAVRNSGGQQELRPVVRTLLKVGDAEWPIELTLTRRDEMGFRMLLGRQALRGRVLVDSGRSYRAGRLSAGSRTHADGPDTLEEQ